MRKAFLLILTLLALNMSACRSCNDTPDIKPDVYEAGVKEDVKPTDTVVSNERWEITLSPAWQQQDENLTGDRGTEFIAANKDLEAIFVLVSKDTNSTFDENAIEYIRTLRGSGFALEYVSYITMNCSKYVVINAIKDGVKGTMWITVDEDHKIGYELSCGGSKNNEEAFVKECDKLAASFKLKDLTRCDLK